jgi:prepilin-type N-terminal cleavage/methylation domain-containing protein
MRLTIDAHQRRRGVGLVELLIALAISATLLAAVGVAVHASFKAYAVNQSQAQLLQRSRLAMNRMLTYIRSTSMHLPDDDDAQTEFEEGRVVHAGAIRMMLNASGGVIFRQNGNELQMIPFTVAGGSFIEGTPRTLLDGVGANDFDITFEPQQSAESIKTGGKYDQLKRASITLTVRPADSTRVIGEAEEGARITLSTSVMPRQNMW